ncbi:MAG: hypothetical protein U0V54_01845 [Saprospiraceae bacterium]
MKLRIKGNSIRLRLTQTEVKTFSAEGYVAETCAVGPMQLTYALKSEDMEAPLSACFDSNLLVVSMSSKLAGPWFESPEVGYRHLAHTNVGEELFLLVEKDFVCLDETFEDQSDNYPNPNSNC